jgi:hypothetical protein
MDILDFNKFKEGFQFIQFNFNIPHNKIYVIAIYDAIRQDITDELFLKKCFNLSAEYTKQEFFKEYGNTPTVKDYIKMLLPEKTTRYRKKLIINCEKEYEGTEEYFGYPDDYQKQIDEAKKNLNINYKPLEGQQTILNTKNSQTYIKAINTNLKSK